MAIELSEKQVKNGWQIVKFGEIAKEVKSTTKDSVEDGLEVYVGLDHLDPQSLRIARKGIIAEDNHSFTRRFSAGQILFGKRRCYQKKAAVVDFEGICSGDIIVMDAIPKKIIPGLLPFIIQSDAFFEWAEKTSSGSLSPRTKWKSLAEFEFPLPPIERQKEILEILEKVEDNSNRKGDFVNYFLKAKSSTCRQLMLRDFTFSQLFMKKDLSLPPGWNLTTIGKVLISIQYGLSEALSKKGKYPVLRMMNFENGYVSPNDLKFINLSKKKAEKFKLNRGDVLFNRTSLKSIPLLLPPIEEIKRIEKVLKEIDSITEVIGRYDRVGKTLNSKVGNRLLVRPSQLEVSNELQ